jgi:hypothetical protein
VAEEILEEPDLEGPPGVPVPVGPDTREITVQVEDNRKPVRVEIATPGISVEIEAPESLDDVAARAMAMWREVRDALPPPEHTYGFVANGAAGSDLIIVGDEIPAEVDRGCDLPGAARRDRAHPRR